MKDGKKDGQNPRVNIARISVATKTQIDWGHWC